MTFHMSVGRLIIVFLFGMYLLVFSVRPRNGFRQVMIVASLLCKMKQSRRFHRHNVSVKEVNSRWLCVFGFHGTVMCDRGG
jgi:hypothetical protein